MTNQNCCVITKRQANLRVYRRAIRRETAQTVTEQSLAKTPINHPTILDYKARTLAGRRYNGDFADWTGFLLDEFGPQKKCLSIGAGIGRVEKYLIRIGFTERFEVVDLNPGFVRTLSKEQSAIEARATDLNFIELPEKTYDFILCHGVLHHLINLEHVLAEMNVGLKANGIILIYEYVGPDRWQFTDQHLDALRRLFPDIELANVPVWKVPAFEAIRSSALLGAIRAQFGPSRIRSINYGGVFFPMVTCNWPKSRNEIDRIVSVDESAQLPPCYHMGVYGKAEAIRPNVTPWTDRELRENLHPKLDVVSSCIRFALSVRHKIRLRSRLKNRLRRSISC